MNHSDVDGKFDELKGKVKQGLGEAFGDDKMANSGAADQVKGHAEQTWGSVKDAAHDATHSTTRTETEVKAEHTGHTLRDDVTRAAENVNDSITRGIDHLRGDR